MVQAQNLRDLRGARDDLERRVHDLRLTRQVAMQALPSIRLVQENDKGLINKINSTLVNTVPLWRQQLAQAITIYRSGRAAETVKAATDLTNELLRANAAEPQDRQRRGAQADRARRVRHRDRQAGQPGADRDHRGEPRHRRRGQARPRRGHRAPGPEIGDDVVDVLDADGQPHQVLGHAGAGEFLRESWRWVVVAGWQARVLASPMLTSRTASLQRVDEARAGLFAAP
jgi:hypothetical protein